MRSSRPIKLVIGDLGTYAGIKPDALARALDADGRPIPGLYAAGNDMASIMGGNYRVRASRWARL